jgi:hypothetical protein
MNLQMGRVHHQDFRLALGQLLQNFAKHLKPAPPNEAAV